MVLWIIVSAAWTIKTQVMWQSWIQVCFSSSKQQGKNMKKTQHIDFFGKRNKSIA